MNNILLDDGIYTKKFNKNIFYIFDEEDPEESYEIDEF